MSDSPGPKPPDSGALQRVGLLVGIPPLLAQFNVPADRVTAGLPFGPEIFEDPNILIPYDLISHVLDNCVRLTGCDHFGLLLGSRAHHGSLGLPAARMQQADNLGEALSAFVRLQQANTRGGAVYLHRWGGTVILGYAIYDRKAVARDQIYQLVMAVAFNTVRRLTNATAQITEIMFSIRQPRNLRPFAAVFDVPLRFGQTQTGLALTVAAMDAPILRPAAANGDRTHSPASSVIPLGNRKWTEVVRHRLRPMLLREDATSTSVAAQLGLNVRTMSRRLAREGTSFQRILDDIRFTAACELLVLTEIPVGEVASALSYSAPGPFIEAFRRWSGSTPLAYRRSARHRRAAGESPAES